MERRKFTSLSEIPHILREDPAVESQQSTKQSPEAHQQRSLLPFGTPASARHKRLWRFLLLLGLACGCFIAIHCFSSDVLNVHRQPPAKTHSWSRAENVPPGRRGQGKRLKLTLSGLPEATGAGVVGQAAAALAEQGELERKGSKPDIAGRVKLTDQITELGGDSALRDSLSTSREEDLPFPGASHSTDLPIEKGNDDDDIRSEAALARQRDAALSVLYGSGLLRNRGKQKPVPLFERLEKDRSSRMNVPNYVDFSSHAFPSQMCTHRCPLRYDRIDYDDIRRGRYQPYLLGERAKPDCNNCDVENLWSHFCQFQTHGPVCPGWLKWQLASDWVKRAEDGSPGVKELLTLTPCDLFAYMKDRTLWLLGDSLTLEASLSSRDVQEWDKAVKCFLFEFWDMELVDLKKMLPGLPARIQGWCSYMAQGARVCFIRANTGFELAEEILPLLPSLGATTSDVMVINFAVWQNKEGEYRRNLTRFANYYGAHKMELPVTIWRDAPVQHFDTDSGDYVWPVPTQECKAVPDVELLQDNSLKALHPSAQVVAEGGWRNKIALPVIRRLGIPIMNTWNQSLPMWQYHTHFSDKDGDCTHMCHPSEYQYWVFELYRKLKSIFPNVVKSE